MPLPMWALMGAGASLGGSLLSGGGQQQPNWGQMGNRYLGEFGSGMRNQFGQNYNQKDLSALTMGAGNAYDYANMGMAKFKASPAYSAMMANMGAGANAAGQRFQSGLSGGLNTGVGRGLSALGNTQTMFNMGMGNANMQNYMGAMNQFNPLANMRMQGAMGLTDRTAGMAQTAMQQYQNEPSWQQRLGGGLMGLGNAAMMYGMLKPQGQQQQQYQNPQPYWH